MKKQSFPPLSRRTFVSALAALGLVIATASSLSLATEFPARDERAKIESLRPTQMEIGKSYVEKKAARWERKADEDGVSNAAFLRERLDEEPLPAVISPRGERFVLDGHHTIAAVYEMLGARAGAFEVPLRILFDFSKAKPDGQPWSYDDFVVALQAPVAEGGLGKGQFTAKVSALPTYAERFARLPRTFQGLKDNPMRSLVGEAFRKLDLKGDWFVDYIEFQVGDLIAQRHELADLEFKESHVEKIENWLSGDEVIRNFLASRLKSRADRPKLEKALGASR